IRLSAPQWFHLTCNPAWWNNVGDALGFTYWGEKLHDPSLLDKARRVVNLALSAPQKEGLFPAIYDLKRHSWIGSFWNFPAQGYDPNAARTYWDWENGIYQTASTSVTAGYLLEYRRTCEDVPGLLPYVRGYGDFL